MGRVRAAFISLLLRREKGVVPDTAAGPIKERGTMRSGQGCGDGEESIEKLREQWTEFTNGIFLAITEEEMNLRRQELKRRIGSDN
jgi:hypothetical protein